MRSVLIAGGAGFIGAALCSRLLGDGMSVTALSRVERGPAPMRLTRYAPDEIAALVAQLRADAVIHAAGSPLVGASLADPDADFANSVVPWRNVLEGVRRSDLRPRVVFLSSASVYGNQEVLPIPETAPLRPISPYGHHRAICEALAAEYSACFAIPTAVLRVFSVFGAGQRRMLVWDLFRKFRDDAQVMLDGTGDEARDFIHVDDLAAQVASVLVKSGAPHAILNVGSGRSVTVRELAQLIGSLLGSSKEVCFSGRTRAGDPLVWRADVRTYQALAGRPVALDFERRLDEVLRQWRA